MVHLASATHVTTLSLAAQMDLSNARVFVAGSDGAGDKEHRS